MANFRKGHDPRGSSDDRRRRKTWLLAIVHHRAIDTYRRSARHNQRSVNLDDHLELRALGEVWDDVDQRLTAEDVRSALDTLPHDQRQAIDLAYFGGLSQSEIAEQEEIPLGKVKGRMRLGLKKIRNHFESRGAAVPR